MTTSEREPCIRRLSDGTTETLPVRRHRGGPENGGDASRQGVTAAGAVLRR